MTKQDMKRKRGPASAEEEKFILANLDLLSDTEIAATLGRTEGFVRKRRAQAPAMVQESANVDAITLLHRSSLWQEVKRTLLTSEITFFESQWVLLIDQFSTNEILPTDELMIKDYLILEVSANRALAQKRDAILRLQEVQTLIEEERKLPEDAQNIGNLSMWYAQQDALRASFHNLDQSHIQFQTRKDAKLRDLKATRDLRFKHIEESKKNIFELIKELDSKAKRKTEGRWMELMKAGADKVQEDWETLTEYEDGSWDKPYLNPEGELRDLENNKGVADETRDS